jgi:glucose-6-phosphate 1-dehydrogenase
MDSSAILSAGIGLKQFDQIAGRVLQQDLRPAGAGYDIVAKLHACRTQPLNLHGQIAHNQMNAIPAAGTRLAAVGHRKGEGIATVGAAKEGSTLARQSGVEAIGIEARAGYYEHAGAIRDIFQNHLLQLLALTAMEPPIDFTSDSVHNEKVKVLRALHTPAPRSVVRGQYGRGFSEGEEVVAYREEAGVASDSMTETFVAAKLYVDNWRWADTPFYVRMGKRLARHETTIAIEFKAAPHPPFEETASEGLRPNVLVVNVQPDEGVSLAIGAKVPGQGMTIRTVHMDFLYGGAFRTGMPEAYERLILDAMLGDSTLFTRTDEVEEQWLLVDSIVAAWQRDKPAFPNYPAGSWGPPNADDLLHRDGRAWRRP